MKNKIIVGAESGKPVGVFVTPTQNYVGYVDSDVIVQEPETSQRQAPEELYRKYDEAAMSNPANPYNAALSWIGNNVSIAPMGIGMVTAPVATVVGLGGDLVGQYIGDRVAGKVLSNSDKPFKVNTDISLTPRSVLKHGVGLIGGLSGAKFGQYGTTERLIGKGAEAEVYSKPFSMWVKKVTSIPPEEMKIRNNTPTFLHSKYLGKIGDYQYLYKQPKAIMFKNPKYTMRAIAQKYAKNDYYPTEIEGLEGPGFINILKKVIANDYGRTGSGQVGWSFNNWKPGFYTVDAAVQPLDEFFLTLKKGGKLNG